jgi:hypothetical protein
VGEVWEEVPREEQTWVPGYEKKLERFVVVGTPRLLPHGDWNKPEAFWHPVLWLDDLGPSQERDPDENGINETHYTNGLFARIE